MNNNFADVKNEVISYFQIYVNSKKRINAAYLIDDQEVDKVFSSFYKLYGYELTEEEKYKIICEVKAKYDVYQEEGSAILGDYEHDYSWYKTFLENQDPNTISYWRRYRNYLLVQKKFPVNVVDTIDKDMNKVMSYIGDPRQDARYSTRGLVVGDVQSGKTSNYIGLITKAADAGYKVFFVLTGTVESLRRQTQIRVEEGFIGFDSINGKDVGVEREQGEYFPQSLTSREKDFGGKDNQNTSNYVHSGRCLIFVVKKNVSVLRKIYSSLKQLNTSIEGQLINQSCLIIDDEADNASINTNKPDNDPTKINKLIRDILRLFTKSSYVGYTATPFANVFIGYDSNDEMLKDDLFPRDFIYALNSPSNYYGAKKYFVEKNTNLRIIDDYDESHFPLKHNKNFCPSRRDLFPSLYEAVNCFLLVNAIRDLTDDNKNTHRSMLVNMTRFTNVQTEIAKDINEYLKDMRNDIRFSTRLPMHKALESNNIRSLKRTFDEQYASNVGVKWEEVFKNLYESTNNIVIRVVNSARTSKKLDYDNTPKGLRVIAVGGLALSRGLTLEGLCVSYFYRNTAVYDVLMQMGRWFGYREDYKDLCKIYITEQSKKYYVDIYNSIEELKNLICEMSVQQKRPDEYGIRVRNDSIDLIITASNKMRSTKKVVDRKSFYGSLFETSYLYRDLNINEENLDSVFKLLGKIERSQRDNTVLHPYFRNVDTKYIQELINSVKFNQDSGSFDVKQIGDFLEKQKNSLTKFDVLVVGGSMEERFQYDPLDIDIKFVKRRYDIQNGNIIRINGQRAHLWGKLDTKYGLTKSEINDLNIEESKAKAEDYLIKGRNPLLIIYFFKPSEYAREGELFSKEDKLYELKFIKDLNSAKYNYLVGLAIGFPKTDFDNAKAINYVVNRTQNYYDKEHDFDEEVEE